MTLTLTLIILIYILMAALTAYLLGRRGMHWSWSPFALWWPLFSLLVPFYALRWLATLGAKHRRG